MNDIRRTILWVIFGFSIILLWDNWQVHNGKQATFFPAPPTANTTAASASPAAPTASNASPSSPSSVPTASNASTAGVGMAAVPGQATAPAKPRERLEVTTDVYRLVFDSEGGSLVQAELLQHADLADRTRNFVLFDESAQRVYMAQTGLIGGDFATHKTPMTAAPGARSLAEGENELNIRFESPVVGGLQLVKTWTLKRGAYDMALTHEIRNTSSTPLAPQLYLQLLRDGNKPPGESSFYSTFTGPAVFTQEKKYQKVEFEDIAKNQAEYAKESSDGYVAMVQHYFASAWLLPEGARREMFMRKVDSNLYSVGMITPLGSIAPGSSKTLEARLFAGPQIETTLETLAPGLELVKDYGWLTILAKPLYWLLDQLHKVLGNWGWAIVGLVLLLKIAFYWLNAKAYASMAKMKAVNPRIMEMRERLKDNPQQMQQEMMRIYREEKVNPMGGCFPIMVQIPVFIALYWVLLSSVEMRNAPWIGWIHDLSTPDPLFILPLLMTLSSLLQTALNPAPPDPMQAKLMWLMPLIFSVMFFFFPAGLVLYWLTNNVLSIAQQWIINTRMGVPPQFNLPKFK
jgi:YidC/Oxa1 family membrane protein insertase